MNKGWDQLPGHAYAPGLEPGWIDLLVAWDKTSSVGVILPSLLFTTVLLVILVRMMAARPRMRQTGVREGKYNHPSQTVERDASVARIIAHTVLDQNFANEPEDGRGRYPVKEGGA